VLEVCQLAVEHTGALHALRRESLEQAPLSFASSPLDDRMREVAAVRALLAGGTGGPVMFGALLDGALVGMAGLLPEGKAKLAHRASVQSMYVRPAARGRGVGAALLQAVIDRARERGVEDLHLGVSAAAGAAVRLYQRAGFEAWGVEPRAMRWQGEATDALQMVLHLQP
jgi:GNAT superfamily N-acetyltransferase